jgi:hypothetical protein
MAFQLNKTEWEVRIFQKANKGGLASTLLTIYEILLVTYES